MSMPVVFQFQGLMPSATVEQVIRHVLFRLEPLRGWVLGVEVQVSRSAKEGLQLRLMLKVPGAPLVVTRRPEGDSAADIGVSALLALRAALIDLQRSTVDAGAAHELRDAA